MPVPRSIRCAPDCIINSLNRVDNQYTPAC